MAAAPISTSSQGGNDTKIANKEIEGFSLDKKLAFIRVAFVLILLIVVVFDRNPTPMEILVYRVILALAAAGIGAVIPGMIDVKFQAAIRAGGAIALFVIVYLVKPANLVLALRTEAQPPPSRQQ